VSLTSYLRHAYQPGYSSQLSVCTAPNRHSSYLQNRYSESATV